ncbi:acetyltransferase [Aeromonas veronii]|uniref:acetyltransferase n=1 Tax=Aeromonas allosaccharophila TaxID=656 RepID=UPI003A456140
MSEIKKQLIIFGCSSFTASILSLCEKIDTIEVVVICVDDEYLISVPKFYNGISVIGFTEAQSLYPDASYILAVGYKNMRARKSIYEKLKSINADIATLISPNAHISTVNIAPGCIIFDGVVVEQGAVINENVTIWSNATICHDVEIKNNCFIAANVTLGGFVKVDALTFIGFSATVIDSITVGCECLVGAGSLVFSDVDDYSKCFGVPARKVGHIDKNTGVRFL